MRQAPPLVPLCLAALLAGLLALKGGVHPRHGAILLMGIALLGAYSVLLNGLTWSRGKAWLPILLVAGVTLQLIPLPSGLRAGLSSSSQIAYDAVERSPTSEERERYWESNTLHSFSVELGDSPTEMLLVKPGDGEAAGLSRPLSLDPGNTRWSIVVWLSGGVCLLLGIRTGRGANPQGFLWCLFGVLVVESLIGLWGVRADSLLFFDKEAYLSSATGTLVNRNHFGTLMLLGLGVSGTLLVGREREGSGPSLLVTQLGAAACFAGLLASQSRAAMVLAGLGLAAGLGTLARRQSIGPKGLYYGGLVLLLAFFAWRTGYFERFDAVGQNDRSLLGRVDIWSHAVEQWRGAMIGGVGLGAFSWAATIQQSDPYVFHFAHAHSDYLQLFTEGGVLVGGALFAAFAGGLYQLTTNWWAHARRYPLLPLFLGLAAALLHGTVDFPFQIPGILLLWLTLAGWLWGQVQPRSSEGSSVRVAGLAAIFVILAGAHQAGSRDRIEHRTLELLHGGVENSTIDEQELEAALRGETAGAREGLGRLALKWAESGSGALTDSARLIRFRGAAEAAQRRAREQPLDANAYVSESLAWANAASVARRDLSDAGSDPENFAFASEWAMHKALILQPTNPLIYEKAAESQLLLARRSPLARGHQRRAATLLGRAMALDPWVAPRAFRLSASLPVEDLRVMTADEPRILYHASREWQRRGLRKEALELASRALELPGAPKETGYQRAELVHALFGIEEAIPAYRSFLASNGGSDTMRGWAFLRVGESAAAEQAFQRALRVNPKNRWAEEGLSAVRSMP